MAAFHEDVPQGVANGGIRHQRDNRNGYDRIAPYRRPAVPSHSRDRFITTHRDLCLDWNVAWVY